MIGALCGIGLGAILGAVAFILVGILTWSSDNGSGAFNLVFWAATIGCSIAGLVQGLKAEEGLNQEHERKVRFRQQLQDFEADWHARLAAVELELQSSKTLACDIPAGTPTVNHWVWNGLVPEAFLDEVPQHLHACLDELEDLLRLHADHCGMDSRENWAQTRAQDCIDHLNTYKNGIAANSIFRRCTSLFAGSRLVADAKRANGMDDAISVRIASGNALAGADKLAAEMPPRERSLWAAWLYAESICDGLAAASALDTCGGSRPGDLTRLTNEHFKRAEVGLRAANCYLPSDMCVVEALLKISQLQRCGAFAELRIAQKYDAR